MIKEFLNSDTVQALANFTEVVGFSILVATYIKTSLIKSKLFKGDTMAINKNEVLNTFAFNPQYEGDIPLKEANFRGSIFIEPNGIISKGEEVFNQIPAHTNKTFLVSKPVFDYCVSKGYRNVAIWNAKQTVYGEDGRAITQKSFIFGDEV